MLGSLGVATLAQAPTQALLPSDEVLPTVLPTFDSKLALEQDEAWSSYFHQTFGELPDGAPAARNYPLHVSDLSMVYVSRLPRGFFDAADKRLIPREDGGTLDMAAGEIESARIELAPDDRAPVDLSQRWTRFGGMDERCPDRPGQLYHNGYEVEPMGTYDIWHDPELQDRPEARSAYAEHAASRGHGIASSFWREYGMFVAERNHTRVEIQHLSKSPNRKVARLEQSATWMYRKTGSGVWYDVGSTIEFERHWQAVQHFLPGNECMRGECERQYAALTHAARAAGYDSIQITRHGDQRCGLTHMEIIDVRSDGTLSCGLPYTSGWSGELPCACDPALPFANCQHDEVVVGTEATAEEQEPPRSQVAQQPQEAAVGPEAAAVEGWALDSRSRAAAAGECPTGQRTASSDECLAAVQAATQRLGLEVHGLKSVTVGPTEGSVPPGCSYSSFSKTAVFNRDPVGGDGWLQSTGSHMQARSSEQAYRLACARVQRRRSSQYRQQYSADGVLTI